MSEIESLFERRCINSYRVKDKNNKLILYRRQDLYKWACEAYERGEDYFYCRPVDPNDTYGELELCGPEYRWFLKDKNSLTDEQINLIKDIMEQPDE